MAKFKKTAIATVLCTLFFAIHILAIEVFLQKHLVPADKKLSDKKIGSLYERGEQAVWTGKQLDTIGMPVGGIATGQLYLHGDGTLGLWWIFNKHIFTGYGATNYVPYKRTSPVDSGFAVVVGEGKNAVTRPLNESFGRIEFIGEYPIGIVRYSDGKLPVEVQMEAFSPFIPLNAKDSALPATVFNITVENTSDDPIQASLLGYLQNAICFHTAPQIQALRRNRTVDQNGRRLIVHTIEKAPPPKAGEQIREPIVLADFEGSDYGDWKAEGEAFGKAPSKGTFPTQQTVSGFLGKGLVNTFIDGDRPHGTLTSPEFEVNRKFINFLIGGGKHDSGTCMNLLVDGKVVRTAAGKDNEKLEPAFWDVRQFQGKKAVIQIVDRISGHWGHINVDQIDLADKVTKGPVGPIEELYDYGSMTLAYAEKSGAVAQESSIKALGDDLAKRITTEPDVSYPAVENRSSITATPLVELAPGGKKTFTFVLAWFFPNHEHGREYVTRFDSAPEVAHYVLDDFERLAGNTRKWHKTFYEDSTLPRWLLFRLHSTVCNLATGTCQWWENGRFWGWEGVGCCPGTCTHVWNYAHAVARLFPELERSVRQMQDFGEGFDEDSGLVGFRSNRAYAADGQCGTVLKAYREHLMSSDNSFLKRNWPRIKKALLFSIGQDGDDDGLIESSQHNTFDINFEGPNTFVGSLYLAALRAGEEMAKEMGDKAFAERCRAIFESGKRLSMQRLWDGEYFVQVVDLEKYPKFQYGPGCLSDQLFGQGWAHRLGLGYIYPRENVEKALQSVWKYNWTPDIAAYNAAHKPERWFARDGEPGLFTCTWPKSEHMDQGVRYRSEVWTGIEYQVAGHMVEEGLVDEALAICDGIQRRYDPAKLNPFNEIECGDHYARAFASWGVYNALAGFEYDGPADHIGFAPAITPHEFRAAFTSARGWGTFGQKRTRNAQTETIALKWGELNVKTLGFKIPRRWEKVEITARLDSESVESTHVLDDDGTITITLSRKTIVNTGRKLHISIERADR